MRAPGLLLLALSSLAPALPLAAQGRLIPRPCQRGDCPPPPPCFRGECPRPGAVIERSGSDVRVELRDRVLRYQVDERFVNLGGTVGEADYVFPLPKNAAFEGLKLEINGELVAGEVLDAERARQMYEAIVRQQRDPALVEWMGHGLLRTRIFPIAPGEEKRVVVRFQAVAEREGDALRVDYRQAGSGERRVVRTADTRDWSPVSARSSFTFVYPDDPQYGTPYSPTHALRTRRESGGRRSVEVIGDVPDVTLLLPVRRPASASVALLSHAPGGEDGFALITVTPPAARWRPTPRDVTLVLDVSGSMSGRKLEQAKAAGRQLLGTLSPEDRFRIVDFSSDVRTFPSDWREEGEGGRGYLRATREKPRATSRSSTRRAGRTSPARWTRRCAGRVRAAGCRWSSSSPTASRPSASGAPRPSPSGPRSGAGAGGSSPSASAPT